MPKLKTMKFKRSSAAGETREFESDISVNSEGRFSAIVPEDVANAIKALPLDNCYWRRVGIQKARKYWHVTCASLDQIQDVILAGLDELLSVEMTVERVIVYAHQVDVSAWENEDGTLHANGYIGDSDQGRWHPMGEHLHATQKTPYFQVGLYAEVFDKVTYRGAHSESIKFQPPAWDHSHLSFPTYGAKLNGFAAMRCPNSPERLPSLPYTEANAKFFYQMLLSMCHLGRNLHEFFTDQTNVVAAIEANKTPMLVQDNS